MSKHMVLKASTNKVGSTSELELGITEEEWNSMKEEEQDEVTREAVWDLVDVWVEAE